MRTGMFGADQAAGRVCTSGDRGCTVWEVRVQQHEQPPRDRRAVLFRWFRICAWLGVSVLGVAMTWSAVSWTIEHGLTAALEVRGAREFTSMYLLGPALTIVGVIGVLKGRR